MSDRRTLYPPIEPYDHGMLVVSPVHTLYYEQSGNPSGKPVLFVHGGPGGGTDPRHRRFFDPARYRIVLFDQRGCGRSTPHASLEDNTTWDLVSDMEKVRAAVGVDRWQVFGGSWGSTLALAYAQRHADRVTELVLRGIFLLRRWELDWFYQGGASRMFPAEWQKFLQPIPVEERGDLLRAYHTRLTGSDPDVALACARAWSVWEGSTSCLFQDPDLITKMDGGHFALAFARIEAHYFVNGGFFARETELLDGVAHIRNIPGVIVQGRYDVVCPAESAWDLARAWPEARLVIVPDAGHSAMEPGILDALVRATDGFAERK